MNTTLTTAELYIELRKVCTREGAMLTSKYFGDSDMHLISIQKGTRADIKEGYGFRYRQSGDSIRFCLWTILQKYRDEQL